MGWVGAGLELAFTLQEVTFQSLRGFGVGWSIVSKVTRLRLIAVSIPERVWGGLERNP